MREYKFRAWDARGTFNNGVPCMHEDVTGTTMFDYIWHDSEFLKMQWTGLTDRNGKEIYESDIIQYDNEKYEVYWHNDWAMFMAKGPQDQTLVRYAEYSEVIGNVFESDSKLQKNT